MKAVLDFVPLMLFFYFAKTQNIMVATQVLLLASTLVYGVLFVLQKYKLEKQQWITLILTVLFCSLTLVLHDDVWLRWKSPIINSIFGLTFLLSTTVAPLFNLGNTPLAQRLLNAVFQLSPKGWKRLNLAWALFFFVMAGLHALFAFVLTTYWIDFKVFGSMILTIMFIVSQFFVLKSYLKLPNEHQK